MDITREQLRATAVASLVRMYRSPAFGAIDSTVDEGGEAIVSWQDFSIVFRLDSEDFTWASHLSFTDDYTADLDIMPGASLDGLPMVLHSVSAAIASLNAMERLESLGDTSEGVDCDPDLEEDEDEDE